jgi:Glycosyltransferase family 87
MPNLNERSHEDINAVQARTNSPSLNAKKAQESLIAAFRDADWLTAERALAWCRVLAVMSVVITIAWLGLSHGGLDMLGKPIGTDFISFWTASRFALAGQPSSAYDITAHAAAQHALFPSSQLNYTAFFYPPTFLLLCLPLATLPYLWALVVWLAVGFAPLFACLRRLLPQRWAIIPIIAYPALLVNAGHGQNGFLSGACLGGGTLLLQRRPFLAGMCLGILVYKPHLLLAVPVALLAARRWAVVVGATTSAIGLCAVSWLVLGTDVWRGFLHVSPLARATLEQGFVGFGKMQSVFAAVRLLHGSIALAYAAQTLVAISACVLLARIAARRPGAQAEGALMVAATLLCTPFLLDYDLVCLALPIAWLVAEAQRTGWRPWEKFVILAVYSLPLLSRSVATMAGVPIAPIILAALLMIVARRAAGKTGCSAETGSDSGQALFSDSRSAFSSRSPRWVS